MKIELMCCESTLLDEISNKKITRNQVSMTYALALRSSEMQTIDFAKVNKAIIERWSMSALHWIKSRAWSGKCFDNKVKPDQNKGE